VQAVDEPGNVATDERAAVALAAVFEAHSRERTARLITPEITLQQLLAVEELTSTLIAPITLSISRVVASPSRTSPSAGSTWLRRCRSYVSSAPGERRPSSTKARNFPIHRSAAAEKQCIAVNSPRRPGSLRSFNLPRRLFVAAVCDLPYAWTVLVLPSKSLYCVAARHVSGLPLASRLTATRGTRMFPR
jgi:hypothetical protein